MEELSFSSLAKKGRDEIDALNAPPAPVAPEPVVEAPKAAATSDVKTEKKEAVPVPATTPAAAASAPEKAAPIETPTV